MHGKSHLLGYVLLAILGSAAAGLDLGHLLFWPCLLGSILVVVIGKVFGAERLVHGALVVAILAAVAMPVYGWLEANAQAALQDPRMWVAVLVVGGGLLLVFASQHQGERRSSRGSRLPVRRRAEVREPAAPLFKWGSDDRRRRARKDELGLFDEDGDERE